MLQVGHPPGPQPTPVRTITADYGYFVSIDFRDYFRIEPPSNEEKCDYDYLEVALSVSLTDMFLSTIPEPT